MAVTSEYLDALVREFSKLPSIGPKSASRLAFHVLTMTGEDVQRLSSLLLAVKEHIRFCSICGGITESEICSICLDEQRDKSSICVLQEPKDLITIENTGQYNGQYHVLHGLISPLDGKGPEDIRVNELIERCKTGTDSIIEVILALNPTVEGDATSLYIANQLHQLGIKTSRIARGLPMGADLEYADHATIVKSFEGRVKIDM